MSKFYNYDTRGASEATQIVNLERMVEERDIEIASLRSRLNALAEELAEAQHHRRMMLDEDLKMRTLVALQTELDAAVEFVRRLRDYIPHELGLANEVDAFLTRATDRENESD